MSLVRLLVFFASVLMVVQPPAVFARSRDSEDKPNGLNFNENMDWFIEPKPLVRSMSPSEMLYPQAFPRKQDSPESFSR